MPAHCRLLIAPVPLSVSKSINTSSDGNQEHVEAGLRTIASRSSRVRMCRGSTTLIRNGSMMVFMGVTFPGSGNSASKGSGYLMSLNSRPSVFVLQLVPD